VEIDGNVTITKKAADPAGVLCISLSGNSETGYYCVYRGTKEQAAAALLLAAKAMALMVKAYGDKEPHTAPEEYSGR
jgi:hypothetical protein